MRIITFTAIAALITPSPVANMGHGVGRVESGSVVDTLPSFASNVGHGVGRVESGSSLDVLGSSSANMGHGAGRVDSGSSISLHYSPNLALGRGQVDAASSAVIVTTTFTYSSDGDTNDILNFVGKNYDAGGTWTNPHTAGRVVVSYSSTGAGSAANLVDRATNGLLYTNNVANSHFQIDFGSGKTVLPVTYSIRHDGETGYYLRNWRLRGSNNGSTWTDLDTRSGDTTINAPNAWGTWTVTGAAAYRYLRVEQTGLNSLSTNFLVFGELQVYGDFTY